MCPLRRVEGHRAGPSALGILIPPGRRTILIVRPRSLSWDLVLLRSPEAGAFRELHREESDALAAELVEALGRWTAGRVEEVEAPDGGYWVRLSVASFALLACARRPGKPYEPEVFPDVESALEAAARLRTVLRPRPGTDQEVYLNTRHFTP